MNFFQNMSETGKGMILMLVGAIFFAYTLNMLGLSLRYLVLICSILMIFVGATMVQPSLKDLFKKKPSDV